MKMNQCWPESVGVSKSRISSPLAKSVGESKSRISKRVGPKRWRIKVPNLKAKFSKLVELLGRS